MKYVYIMKGHFDYLGKTLIMSCFSSRKKAEKSLKERIKFYKANPTLGIKNPEKNIEIVKEILW